MHTYLLELLECPICHGELSWTITERDAERILAADIQCRVCSAAYAVHDGIGMFLTPNLPREDRWQWADSQLTQILRQQPELERQLMSSPLDTLGPADQFLRALVLEERGNYADAKSVHDLAQTGLYTPEYLACWQSQVNYCLDWLAGSAGPVVDLASGRCTFVEQLARSLKRFIVATDFSPRVLQRDRLWLQAHDLYGQISLLAFDARRTPFKSGSIMTLTTNLGLPNIQKPDHLLRELRRIVDGTFLAISHFFPEKDEVNGRQISELGLTASLFRSTTLESLTSAGWQVEVMNTCSGKARPTPTSRYLAGARIDSLPATETLLEWCTLLATGQKRMSKTLPMNTGNVPLSVNRSRSM